MKMVHVTLRCRNKAGLQSTLSSNGVKISNLPPQTTSAEVEILPHSMTEYNCRDHYQGDITKLRVKWTGFTDTAGLDSYMVRINALIYSHRGLANTCLLTFVHIHIWGLTLFSHVEGPSLSWSYGCWIYNYLHNQCLSPQKLWVRIPLMARCT